MTYTDLFWHLASFVAPALVLAPAMVLASELLGRRAARKIGVLAQAGINFCVCVLVLGAGLVWTGEDGRMATYMALVLASTLCQMLLTRPRSRQ